ncbi:somatostatin receptor type 1-like [Dendronephthya gigantea]|uniref:somatostatin receptor type 1-like n=1 Tax=Dendronephthya gigantea TaxID=151771 RepID=UPI00106C138A|nr:somatostatin receptor type 1-like [Dendronephthya gigantea]
MANTRACNSTAILNNSSLGNIVNAQNSTRRENAFQFGGALEDNRLMSGLFIFIAVLSFVGNLLVLVLFLHNKKWLKRTYGRLVFALALVDLLTAVCLFATPLAVHHEKRMERPTSAIAREMYCRLLWSHYVLFSFGITSVYTCLVLTTERWIAVTKPLYIRKYKPSRRTCFACLALPWLAGFLLEANVVKETRTANFDDGTFSCEWRAQEHAGKTTPALLAVVSFLGAMLIPLLIITVMYAHILVTLKKQNLKRKNSFIAESVRPTSTFYKLALRRATKMAACATFAVVICWLPCQAYSLAAQLGFAPTETTLHQVLNLLAFFNSCLNPALYAFTNGVFRKKFSEVFTRLSCHSDNPPANNLPSALV